VSQAPFDSLNLSFGVGDSDQAVAANRSRVLNALGLARLFTPRQTHSAAVQQVDEATAASAATIEADACFTAVRGLALGICVADCLSVFVYGTDPDWVGIAHCGWRGTTSRIAVLLAGRAAAAFGTRPDRMSFALGPCICPSCYVVGADVAGEFSRSFPAGRGIVRPTQEPGRFALDLRDANRCLLSGLGLREVGSLDLCSFEEPHCCFSVRRGRVTGRNLTLIALDAGSGLPGQASGLPEAALREK
jgi:YfiH family protein